MSETPGRVLGRLFVETMLAPDEDGVNIWRGSEADGYRDEFERIAAAFLAEMVDAEQLTEARKALAVASLTGTLRRSQTPPTIEVPYFALVRAIDALESFQWTATAQEEAE